MAGPTALNSPAQPALPTVENDSMRARILSWLRSPLGIVLIALLLRLTAIGYIHTYRFSLRQEQFGFGWESGRIARSLASGEGFSSPFHAHTGPTAWVAPLYPFLIAGVFKLFGIYTNTSSFILLALNSLFSALTCWTIYLIAKKTFDQKTALWAAWLWAVLPYVLYWCIRWVWETSLTALLLSLMVLIALELEKSANLKLWILNGLLWAALALTNPSVLSLLPFMAGWIFYQQYRNHVAGLKRIFTSALLAGIVFIAGISPWTLRNHRVFGRWIFIRSNFGAELRMGNSPQARGEWMWYLHPSQDPTQMAKYARMGELAYIAERKREALDFIEQHPGRFAELMLIKAFYFWDGTPRASEFPGSAQARNALFLASSVLAFWGLWFAAATKKRGVFLFATLLLIYPLVYYVVFPHPRYRHPIEAEMLILSVFLVRNAWTRSLNTSKRNSSAHV